MNSTSKLLERLKTKCNLLVLNVNFEHAHKERIRFLEVVVFHTFCGYESLIIQESLDRGRISIALQEVVIKLPDEVPILNDGGVNSLLQNALVECFALCLVREVHILANIGVDDIVELIVVR